MVALKARDVDDFLIAPPTAINAILVYGPDRGLVTERLGVLLSHFATDPNDPFSVSQLNDAELAKTPARLAEELGGLCFGTNRRTVVVRASGGASADVIVAALEDQSAAILLVGAGDLKPRSAVRKAFEAAPNAAALPCYHDDDRSLVKLIDQVLAEFDQTMEPEARSNLRDRLGSDRLASRGEIEKLALYAGPGAHITAVDVDAICSDVSRETLDQLVDAVGEGDPPALERLLGKARETGTASGQLMRAVLSHMQTLHRLSNQITRGEALSAVIGRMRPPVHFTRRDSLTRQLRLWREPLLRRALELAAEGERASRGDQALSAVAVARSLLQITMLVARSRPH